MNVLLLILGSCSVEVPPSEPVDRVPLVADTRRLFRASMSLRGRPPSPDEVSELVEHPRHLDALVAAMVDDPGFATTISDMHAEQLRLRWDVIAKPPNMAELETFSQGAVAYSLDETPIKLIEHVVTSGLPYTDIVAGDVAMSDAISSLAYGLPHDPDGPEWQPTWWTDGRPKAGILSSTAVWQRYQGPENNRMRARSAWILEELLCEDLAERSGSGIIDPRIAEEAVRDDPECVGCHAVMDPVASGVYGFLDSAIALEISGAYARGCEGEDADICYPLRFWQPELIGDRARFGGPPISLYGTPAADLEELGQLIADDPRFAECSARRFWGWMTHQPARDIDPELAEELAADLVSSGWDARQLAVDIALHPRFADGSPDAPPYAIRPGQLEQTILSVTGYDWRANPDRVPCTNAANCWGDVGLANTEKHGLRSLLGGIDGWTIIEPISGALPTRELGLEWVATEAAHYVVERDVALGPGKGELLVQADTTDPELAREQLAELHLRLFGLPVAPTSPEVDDAYALFEALLASSGDSKGAWKSLLSALLRDPRLVVL